MVDSPKGPTLERQNKKKKKKKLNVMTQYMDICTRTLDLFIEFNHFYVAFK